MMNEEFEKFNPNEAERIFKNGSTWDIIETVISISLCCSEREWVKKRVLEFLEDPNEEIVSAAIISVAHIARLDKWCNTSMVSMAFQGIRNNFPALNGRIDDAIDDICMFSKADYSDFL